MGKDGVGNLGRDPLKGLLRKKNPIRCVKSWNKKAPRLLGAFDEAEYLVFRVDHALDELWGKSRNSIFDRFFLSDHLAHIRGFAVAF